MAIKALILRRSIDEKKKALEELRSKNFATREAELEAALAEAETEEQVSAVKAEAETFEAEKAECETAKEALEAEIRDLEKDLEDEEKRMAPPEPKKEERKVEKRVEYRKKFAGMTMEERDAFFSNDEVKTFLGEVRTAIKEKRAISNAGLLIPEVFLGLIRENIQNYSKLYRYVDVRRLSGTGREVIMGSYPEAVWTEACANLNELDLSFTEVEVDGYKVGGFFAICNATLEDSEVDLASELLTALSQAIGFALDKAILYGTGVKMPTGVATTIVADYSTDNIITHAATVTGVDLFAAFVGDIGVANSAYAKGPAAWVMNEKTYAAVVANSLSVNAAGAIVAGVDNRMPVVGGDIVKLSFVPDDVIIAGYFDCYLLAERAGVRLDRSEHYKFVEDQTIFRGTARYDGKAKIGDAFVLIGINGETPDDTMTFAPDTANTEPEPDPGE